MALALADSSAFREAAWKRFHAALRKARQLEADLDDFQCNALPRLMEWLGSVRPERFRVYQLLEQTQRRDVALHKAAELESRISGIPLREALERVMTARASDAPPPQPEADDDDCGDHESFLEFLDRVEREFDDCLGAVSLQRRRKAELVAQYERLAHCRRLRLKCAYRALVRLLHPDALSGGPNRDLPERGMLWGEAQAAYRRSDPDRLEAILDRTRVLIQEREAGVSMSVLAVLTREQTQRAARAHYKLRKLRRHPAWRFSSAGATPEFEQYAEEWLEFQIARMERDLNRIHRKWKKAPRRNVPPRHPPPRVRMSRPVATADCFSDVRCSSDFRS